MDWLTDFLTAHAQRLLGYDIVIWAIARSHLLIAILIPLFAIGMMRLFRAKNRGNVVLIVLSVVTGIVYLYIEFFVGGVGPVCCITRAGMDWQNTQASGWMGIFVITLLVLACFRMAKLGDPMTRALLNISGWLTVVTWFSVLFFANATYITGTLAFGAEVVAAFAIALIAGKTLGIYISVKRNSGVMSNEKANIDWNRLRPRSRNGSSTLVHRDDL